MEGGYVCMSTCERRIWYKVLVGAVVCAVRSMLIGSRCGMFDASVRKVFATEWEVEVDVGVVCYCVRS
jgi:hypothetical protein